MDYTQQAMKEELKELQAIMPMCKRQYRTICARIDRRIANGKTDTNTYKTSPEYNNRKTTLLDNKNYARYLHLAYGYSRGTPYLDIENSVSVNNEPELEAILDVLKYFNVSHTAESVYEWLPEVEEVLAVA